MKTVSLALGAVVLVLLGGLSGCTPSTSEGGAELASAVVAAPDVPTLLTPGPAGAEPLAAAPRLEEASAVAAKPDVAPVAVARPDVAPAAVAKADVAPAAVAKADVAPEPAAGVVEARTEPAPTKDLDASPPAKARAGQPAAIAADGVGKGDVAVYVLDGRIVERRNPYALFAFERELPIGEFLATTRKLADMETVAAILLRIGRFEPGFAQLGELQAALRAARAKGRRVIAYLETGAQPAYLLACAADEIYLSPGASLELHGIDIGLVYLRGLLDKVGLAFDLEAIGRYKTGGETLTRTDMSPEQREELNQIADELFAFILDAIELRGLTRETSRALVDAGPYPPAEALRLGLVDGLEDWASLRDRVRTAAGGKVGVQYPEVPEAVDLSSLMGILSLLSRSPDGPPPHRPKVAILYAIGPIVDGRDPEAELWGEEGVQGDRMVKAIDDLARDETVKGVVLRIDSPGGSALASDRMWQALRRLREAKPVVASLGDVAASGGYYMAAAADVIVAEPTTLTGSIGVIGGKLVIGGLQDLLGMRVESITRGQNAGMMSPYAGFSDMQRARLQAMLRDTYERFLSRVAEGRGRSVREIAALAEGRVWTGADAHENGLVDRLGGLDDALALVREKAGVDPGLPAYAYPPPRSLMELLQEGPEARLGGLRSQLAARVGLAGGELATLAQTLERVGLGALPDAVRILSLLEGESVLVHAPFVMTVR